MFQIRDILVRIRILKSVPLTNGSGCGSGSVPKFQWLLGCKKNKFFHIFQCFKNEILKLQNCKNMFWRIKFNFNQENFVLKFYFATIISVRSTLLWDREGSGSGSVRYLWLTDPDADPGGPKTYGSCGTLLLIQAESFFATGLKEGLNDPDPKTMNVSLPVYLIGESQGLGVPTATGHLNHPVAGQRLHLNQRKYAILI